MSETKKPTAEQMLVLLDTINRIEGIHDVRIEISRSRWRDGDEWKLWLTAYSWPGSLIRAVMDSCEVTGSETQWSGSSVRREGSDLVTLVCQLNTRSQPTNGATA